jgi:hypothetical protein
MYISSNFITSFNYCPNRVKMDAISLESLSLSDPKTSKRQPHRTTIARREQGKTRTRHEYRESKQLLSAPQELVLVKEINRLTNQGLPPTCAMVRNFAEYILKKRPGERWSSEFVKRHSKILKSGFLAGADLNRKKADNAFQYTLYFELVCSLLIT